MNFNKKLIKLRKERGLSHLCFDYLVKSEFLWETWGSVVRL